MKFLILILDFGYNIFKITIKKIYSSNNEVFRFFQLFMLFRIFEMYQKYTLIS